jgi:hypothetical protein
MIGRPAGKLRRYGPATIVALIAVLLVVVGLLVWDSYLAPPELVVTTEPEDATVIIDGEEVGQGSMEISSLEAGLHRVSAKADGFLPSEVQLVNLEPGRRSSLMVRLVRVDSTPKFKRVSFTSDPPGAAVFILKQMRGMTPLPAIRIPTTGADVRLVLPGHDDIELILQPGMIESSYDLRFDTISPVIATPDAGSAGDADTGPPPSSDTGRQVRVTFTSTPPGARIVINNRPSGTTPRVLSVAEGTIRLRYEKPGYKTVRRRVNTATRNRVSIILTETGENGGGGETPEQVKVGVTFRVFAPSLGRVVPSTLRVGAVRARVPESGLVKLRLNIGEYTARASAPALGLSGQKKVKIVAGMPKTPIRVLLYPAGP